MTPANNKYGERGRAAMRISRKTGLTLAVLALAAGCTPTGQPMGPGQMMSRVGMPGAGGIGAGGIGAHDSKLCGLRAKSRQDIRHNEIE